MILGGMHYKWAYVMPLVLQALVMPLQVLESPLFAIHMRGKEAKGGLKRPFPAPNPFGMPTPREQDSPELEEVEQLIRVKELFEGASLGITHTDGLVITRTDEAAEVGWAEGDKIVEVNGEAVSA